ncbi:mRNA splicing protein prp28 [Sorochytrium milnesiophthora]
MVIEKKDPLSLEDVLKKRAQEKEAAAKPKFLSKEERAKIALEKRAKEVEALRDRQDEVRKESEAFLKNAEALRREQEERERENARYNNRSGSSRFNDRQGNNRGRGRGGRDRNNRGDRGGRDYSRERNTDRAHDRGDKATEQKPGNSEKEVHLTEEEMKAVRARYMGNEKEKRKVRRMNDRKFVFDWDAQEDTSVDHNPLYAKRTDSILFGRGHIGGIDYDEQSSVRKDSFYTKLAEERQTDAERIRTQERRKQEKKREAKANWDERHWKEKELHEMRERDWRIFKEDFNISTKGGKLPNPIRFWRESNIPKRILDVIEEVGYTEPTPIQRQAIPIGMQNRDIIGIAETGSGKTASFLIPMLSFIMQLPPLTPENAGDGPYALIMVPTRELAQQIEKETQKFSKPMNFTSVSIIGGHSTEEQTMNLRNGAHIIIATPGRLKDFLERRIIVLNQCTYVVMDEADRMIEMGFENDVNFILDALPVSNLKPGDEENGDAAGDGADGAAAAGDVKMADAAPEVARQRSASAEPMAADDGVVDTQYRQTTMFSATMPPAVERLARKYLRHPAVVTIGTAGQAVDTVTQHVEFVNDDGKKRARMMQLLSEYDPPVIIFLNQKKTVDMLGKTLSKEGYSVVTLHGGKSQELREYGLAQLRNGEADVLVATDVAGRGLDVPNVSLVINYDMAKNIEDYTHRIGRTGRAGKKGVAVTFLTNNDTDVMYDLKQMLVASPVSTCPPELRSHEAAQVKPGTFVAKRKFEETFPQLGALAQSLSKTAKLSAGWTSQLPAVSVGDDAQTFDAVLFPLATRFKVDRRHQAELIDAINAASQQVATAVAELETQSQEPVSMDSICQLAQDQLGKHAIVRTAGQHLPGYHTLVCTHGEVDCRCGTKGGALYQHLAALPRSEVGTVWQVSHIGGHKYAANTYPDGHWHALYEGTEADARAVATLIANGQVDAARWRGRLGTTPDIQKTKPAIAPCQAGRDAFRAQQMQ